MHDDEKTKTHLTNWLCQSLPFFQIKFASSLKSSLVLQIRGDPIISKFLNLNFHSSKDCLRKTDFSVAVAINYQQVLIPQTFYDI
jgi:hypothetical protein